MSNFGSTAAIVALVFWAFAIVAFILILVNDTGRAGLIVLSVDFMLVTLLAWLLAAGVITTNS